MAGVSTISSVSTSTNGTWTPVTCTIFPDNPTYCDIVVTVRRVVASLSLIGCLFMIGIIWLYRKYIVFSQRLILYLSIAAFMDCIAYLMGDIHPDGPVCDFQAFWLTYFDWAVLLWVSCVTFNLYMNVVRMRLTERFEWLYHLLCWLFPLVMSCLPFIGDHYGPAGAWCWIKEEWEWRAGIWYGPLFSIIIIMVITYVYIIWRIKKRAQRWEGTYDPDVEQHKQLMKDDIKVLRAYPFIYLAVSIFPLINRIQNAVAHEKHAFVLVLLASISAPLHGALNAVVFGMDQDTMSRLTPSQIKVALVSRYRGHDTVREYPVAYRSKEANPQAIQELQFPKFNHVSYSRLY